MRKTLDLSPNYSKKSRLKSDIKFVIIHYTGMQSEIESLKRLKNKNSKVSCHYFIGKKGEIIQLVIADEVYKEEKTILVDLIVAAHNNAKTNLKSKTNDEISKATGEFGIPGFKWPL